MTRKNQCGTKLIKLLLGILLTVFILTTPVLSYDADLIRDSNHGVRIHESVLQKFLEIPHAVESPKGQSAIQVKSQTVRKNFVNTIQEKIRLAEYQITWQEHTFLPDRKPAYQAPNRGHNFRTYFTPAGIRVIPRNEENPAWMISIGVTGYGYAGNVKPLTESTLTIDQARATYTYEGFSEWYINDEKGLEQGFTLTERPPITGVGEDRMLTIEMKVDGNLKPMLTNQGETVRFVAFDGEPVASFGKLAAYDAQGEKLLTSFALAESAKKDKSWRLSINLDETDAVYPIVVDPLLTTETKKLVAAGGSGEYFGDTVALDGNILAVGAPQDSDQGSGAGAVYVFYRDQGGSENWGLIKKIYATDTDDSSGNFGRSLAISGSTLVVGASESCYIFGRYQGGTDNWGKVQKVYYSTVGPWNGQSFGHAVDVDGDTLVVGAPETGLLGKGSAYVFERNAGGSNNWGPVDGLSLPNMYRDQNEYVGYAVGISGNVIIVGAPGMEATYTGKGMVLKFVKNSSGDWPESPTSEISPWFQDVSDDSQFGYSVDIDGNTMLIGAPEDTYGAAHGSANIYYTDKVNHLKLKASDAAASDRFGNAVAIRGDVVVVGAPYANNFAGKTYGYERNLGGTENWGQYPVTTAPSGQAGDKFGSSVAVDGVTLVVGVPGDDDYGNGSGSAYVFTKSYFLGWYWSHEKKLNTAAGSQDFFASAVSVSGEFAVVGASQCDGGAPNSGAAFLFSRDLGGLDNWGKVKKLTAADGAAGDMFGYSASIDGEFIVVGAPFDDDDGSNSGSAYQYWRNLGEDDSWGQIAKLTATDGAAGDQFGYSVSAQWTTALVGAPYDNDDGSDSGSAYVFYQGNQFKKLRGFPDGAANDHFGWSVSYSNKAYNWVVIGAPDDDDAVKGVDSGSAYFFEKDWGTPDSWSRHSKVTATDGAAGDKFGWSVAMLSTGTNLNGVIGAPFKSGGGGAAYIFWPTVWGSFEIKKLLPGDSPSFNFGNAVAIDGDNVAVGAPGPAQYLLYSGAAYVFGRHQDGTDAWGQSFKLAPSAGENRDLFGYSVSLNEDTVIIGAPWHDANGNDAGAAYVYDLANPVGLAGDVDGDGDTDGSDLGDLADNFGCTGSCLCDFNGDGIVDGADLVEFLNSFGWPGLP